MHPPPSTPEEEQIRDVFTYFGLAGFAAQSLEKGLCNFLMLYEMVTGKFVSLAGFDAREKAVQKKTLGQLVKDIAPHVTFAETTDAAVFDNALAKRNHLLHDYFWDRAVEFASTNGRRSMIAELDATRQLLENAELLVVCIYEATRKAVGLPDDRINAAFEKLRRQAAQLDGEKLGSDI